MVCHINFKLIQEIDLFGREPKLYYKEKPKRKTYFGSFATITYAVIYIAFFVYKINKMLQKADVSFYETYVYTNGTPEIELNNENFYGGFSLGDPSTQKTFIDESIYYPRGFFIYAKKINNEWTYVRKPLKFETCQLNQFGSKYRKAFSDVPLDNLYCVIYEEENIERLRGYMTTNDYSFIQIDFVPCNNLTNNNTCKPKEELDKIFLNTFIEFKMQDLELTPQIYKTPVQFERKDVKGFAFKNLYQKIYTHLQIVNIETDEDIIGFKDFHIKNEKYLKYEESFVHTNPRENDIYNTPGEPLCTVIIQLAGKVLTQKRTYPKLIDVLGEVGGFMEVVYSFFKVILIFITDILYDISLVNNLFSFNMVKKVIIIKNLKRKEIENISSGKNEQEKMSVIKPQIIDMSSSRRDLDINMSKDLISKDSTQNNIINRNKISKGPLISRNLKLPNRRSYKIKPKFSKNSVISNFNTYGSSEVKRISIAGKNFKSESNKKIFNNYNTNNYNINNLNITDVKERNTETEKDNKNDKIIEKIKFNILYTYFCFLCLRRKKNLQNDLLDKGMTIVYQKLDIFNIFKKLYLLDSKSEEINLI
jgi:hypothetical protein